MWEVRDEDSGIFVSLLMKEKHILKPDGKDPRWAIDLILHYF